MKRLAKKRRRILRNTFYPDLKIQLFYKEFTLTLNLEVDCGNKEKSYWIKKLGSWSEPTLLVTITHKRAKRMAGYATLAKNSMALSSSVFVITLYDFYTVDILKWCLTLCDPSELIVYLYQKKKE